MPELLPTEIIYLLPKSGDNKEVRNYRPIICLTNLHNAPRGKLPESLHIWKIRAYWQQSKNDTTLKVKVVRINDIKRDI